MSYELLETDEWWPLHTPFGEVLLAGDEEVLHSVLLPGDPGASIVQGRRGRPGAVAEAERQLRAYFSGGLQSFVLPLDPRGTEWQKKVWRALSGIPYGETRSYGDVAKAVGKPKAARAVGRANNQNPLPLVIPCHRVVGSDGSLTGYGGGLDLKARLLAHEREVLARAQ